MCLYFNMYLSLKILWPESIKHLNGFKMQDKFSWTALWNTDISIL